VAIAAGGDQGRDSGDDPNREVTRQVGCSNAIAFGKVRVEIHVVHSYIAHLSVSDRARLNPVFQVIQKLSIGTSHPLLAIGVVQPNTKNSSNRLQ